MNSKKQTNNLNSSEKIAGKSFETTDYEGKTQLEKGLAETHEQVSDDYFEGTVDQLLEKEKTK